MLASLATLGVYLIGALVIAAVLMEIQNQVVRDITVYGMTMILYAVFFYRFHMHDRLNTYAKHTHKFDPKAELVAYISSEGKIMFVIYGIAAAVTEISALIMQNAPQNPIVFSTMFCLGPWMVLKIPVLRSIVAFAYASTVVCLLAVLRSRKIHEEESMRKKK